MTVGFDLGGANAEAIADKIGVIKVDQPGPGRIAFGCKAVRFFVPLGGLPEGNRLRFRGGA